jgi:two-component system phosphate regulon response regulator PhoB
VEPIGVSRPERGTPPSDQRRRDNRRTRVLIAEDDDSLRTLIRLSVDIGELDIDEAADGEAAILLAHENPPDIALLDWSMPGMTGLEVCRALRADPRSANALIVVVTARVFKGDREEALDAGADRYLGKPFSPVELLEIVRHAL